MATPDEIREELKKQAGQRVNPLLKGLSMLTGGIAGEFTGTNEQIRQQRQAKRALMEENLSALQEERLMQRLKAQQDEMLKRQIELENERTKADLQRRYEEAAGAEDVLSGNTFVGPVSQYRELGRRTARLQRLATGEKEAAEKAGLIGRLTAEMGPTEKAAIEAGAMPDYSTLDINTLRRIASASDVSLRQKQEARQAKQDEGRVYVSRNASGDVSVQGPADLVSRFQSANPDFFKKKKDSPYKVSMRETEDGRSFNVDFGEMSADEIKGIAPQLEDMKKAYGASFDSQAALGGAANQPAKPIKGPAAEKGAAQVIRGSGETRGGAAAAVAAEMAPIQEAAPQALGPMSPEQEFAAINRKLAQIEARGGASALGARETLTTPFYTDVARELNVQPEQVGASVYQRTPRTVVSQNFPMEQFMNLPEEVRNRMYIEAMNKSAQAMQQAKYKPTGTFSEYRLNDPWIGSMFDKLSR